MKTGDGLTLTCLVAGDEPDSIVWYKDGVAVQSASAIFDIPSNYDPLTYTKVGLVVVRLGVRTRLSFQSMT